MIIEIISVKYIDFISQSFSLLIETDGPDDDLSDLNNDIVSVTVSVKCCWEQYRVRVTVAGGSPVLQVSVALLRHVPGDPDAAAPVGHPGTEVVDAGGLMESSQPPLIVLRQR